MAKLPYSDVVEAYRLDRYDNFYRARGSKHQGVVEAYRLDRYDNKFGVIILALSKVVEAYGCRSH